jgi:hypothetical protein
MNAVFVGEESEPFSTCLVAVADVQLVSTFIYGVY